MLRGAFGIAVATGLDAWPTPARAAATTKATEVTGTAAADLAVGDAAYGLSWLAGDTHVHDDHSSDGSFLRQTAGQGSPGNLAVGDQIGQAERTGLAWLPLTDHRTYSQHYDPQWTSSGLVLVTGEEANGSPHAIVLGAVDEIVDGSNPPGSAGHRHVQQAVWEAHAQGAVWGTAHPTYQGAGALATNANVVGIDWIELWNKASDPDGDVDYAERQWNAGFRTGVAGACDDHFKELWAVAGPGMPCTSVLAAEATERAILDALRRGRTTVSQNPLLGIVTLEADLDGDGRYEAIGGDEVTVRAGTAATLRVRVQRGAGLTLLLYAAPGRSAAPLLSMTLTGPDQTFTVPVVVADGFGWWRAELRGPGGPSGLKGQTDPSDQFLGATAPVFTTTAAPAAPNPPTALPAPSVPSAYDEEQAPLVLGERGSFTGFPDVAAVGPLTHVVAERHLPAGTTVVHRCVGGPSSAETRLTPSTGARHPRVAVGGDEVWVVWQDDRGNQRPHRPNIYARGSSDGGRTWRREVQVTDVPAGVRAERPAVLVLASGQVVIAWQENASPGAFEIKVQALGVDRVPMVVSAPGKNVNAGTPDDTRSPRYPASLFPSLTALPGGDVGVAWQDNRYDVDPLFTGHTDPSGEPVDTTDPDAWEPMVAVRTGTTWSAPRRIAPDAARAQRHPSLAAVADRLVCVWDSKSSTSSSGSDVTLRWSASSDSGVTWSAAGDLDLQSHAMQQRPRLGIDPDGGVRVVWFDSRSADWRWRVRTARLVEDTWVDPTDVSHAGNATFPAVSAGRVAFTTDRAAAQQRDVTQQVAVASLTVPDPSPAVPESPYAVLLPAAGLVTAAALAAAAHRRSSPDEQPTQPC